MSSCFSCKLATGRMRSYCGCETRVYHRKCILMEPTITNTWCRTCGSKFNVKPVKKIKEHDECAVSAAFLIAILFFTFFFDAHMSLAMWILPDFGIITLGALLALLAVEVFAIRFVIELFA